MKINSLIQTLVPDFNLSEIFSWKSPLVWYFAISIILFIYVVIGNQNEGLFLAIFNLAGNSHFFDVIMKFSAKYLFILVLLIAFLWYIIKKRRSYIVIGFSFIFVGIIAYILSKVGTHLIIDVRPYIEYHLIPLISVSKDNGFPSDHALLTFAIASVCALYSKRIGWVLFILSFIVGFARIFVEAHHPLDIIGSMLIVAISVLLLVTLGKISKYESKKDNL